MKKILLLILTFILVTNCNTLAQDCCKNKGYDYERDYKCTQLIQRIKMQRNTLYNVLGLSQEQQELKDEIEFRRNTEAKPYADDFKCQKRKLQLLAQTSLDSPEFKKQRKITRKSYKKLQKVHKKYDKEFTKILCTTQKTKFKEIVKLTKRDIKYCRMNKKACPKDPYLNTFGKCDAKNVCEVCEKHSHPHLFNRQCKFVEELIQE